MLPPLYLESFLFITSLRYLLKCHLIREDFPVVTTPPPTHKVMSSSSLSLYKSHTTINRTQISSSPASAPGMFFYQWLTGITLLHPGTQAGACEILTLLHTQYSQIHHPLFSLITALTHHFINSQINGYKATSSTPPPAPKYSLF